MKRNPIVFGLVILCLIVVVWYRPIMERQRRHTQRLAAEYGPLLVLDATTKSILVGADRVETFRLIEDADIERTPAELAEEQAASSGPHVKKLDDYTILRVGPLQSRSFAAGLVGALSKVNGPGMMTQCFSPGVGYRVWEGQAHVDLCVCFYCSGVEIITKDATHKIVYQEHGSLGRSRAAFLALSRQAFPNDAALAAVKDTEGD